MTRVIDRSRLEDKPGRAGGNPASTLRGVIRFLPVRGVIRFLPVRRNATLTPCGRFGAPIGRICLTVILSFLPLFGAKTAPAAPPVLSTGALVDLDARQLEQLKAAPGVYHFDTLPHPVTSGDPQPWVFIPIPASLGDGFLLAHQPDLDDALAAVAKPVGNRAESEDRASGAVSTVSGPWMWSLRTGYRHDELSWSIAGFTPGPALLPDLPAEFHNQFVNVLSELTWEDIQAATLGFSLQRRIGKNFRLLGSVEYGMVVDGDNRDSDYAGDDRTLEFSRSNNSADDGDLWDLALALGYDLRLPPGGRLTVSPLVGYSLHVQNLTLSEGVQTVSEFGFPVSVGPFPELDSTYDANWYGPWVGLEAVYKSDGNPAPAAGFELSLGVEYHWADYDADATWNLRSDFRQPNSFEHKADGGGVVLRGGFAYLFDSRWSLLVEAEYQDWETDPGVDRVFFSDGTAGRTPLNAVEWESYAVSVGIRCRF